MGMKILRRCIGFWSAMPAILALTSGSALGQKPVVNPTTPPPSTKEVPEKTTKTAVPPAEAPDPAVLKVGDEQITKGDFEFMLSTLDQNGQQTLATQGRKPFGEQYVMILLLYKKGLSEHLDATPELSRELAMGRLRTIAQAEYQHLGEQTTVTPDEEDAFYKAHQQDLEEREIREVAVVRKPKGAAADARGLDDDAARQRAETIRKALVSGADPAKLVQDFAVANTVLIDAKPNRIRHGQLIATLDKPAFELKDGEVSDIIETPQAFVFIQIVGRHTPDLKEVTSEIENAIRQQKVNAQMQQLRQTSNVWMDDQYFTAPKTVTPPAPAQPPTTPQKP
jgi:hypothetical protein